MGTSKSLQWLFQMTHNEWSRSGLIVVELCQLGGYGFISNSITFFLDLT